MRWSTADGRISIVYDNPARFSYSMKATVNGVPILDKRGTFAELLASRQSESVPFSSATYTCQAGGFRLVMPVPNGKGALELPWTSG